MNQKKMPVKIWLLRFTQMNLGEVDLLPMQAIPE